MRTDDAAARRSATCTPTTRCAARSSIGCAGASPGSVAAVDGVSFDLRKRRGARAGRRVGLRQDDARAAPCSGWSRRPAAASSSSGDEITGLDETRDAPAAPAAADRLPGPARVAEPGDDDRRLGRRPAALPRARASDAPSASGWSPRRSSGSASRPPRSSPTSTRPTSPAARSSAPCSRGRSSSAPTSWSPTSRSRCST